MSDGQITLAPDPGGEITRSDTTLGDGPAGTTGDGGHLSPGTVLSGRYEIQKLLGQGGMGAVYRAHDRELRRLVALKIIRPDLAASSKVLERFKQELVLSRQVSHRNVVRIYDMGVHEELKFITMEYIAGRDLSDVMERRRLSTDEVVNIVRQVCQALEAAHNEHIVHRDLKPQNIMMSDEGRIWVMDFGLARTLENTSMTQSGVVLGTPDYMSPEQARGEKVDHRSDIFSLGVMMYEMLTGVLPYKADSMIASLVMRTQKAPVPPITVAPDVPKGLNDIVLQCLGIERDQRYQSVTEIIADLNAYSGAQSPAASRMLDLREQTLALQMETARLQSVAAATPPPAYVPPVQATGRRDWLLLGGAAILASAGGVFFWRGRQPSQPAAAQKPVTLLVADFVNETGESVFDGTLEPTFTFALEGAGFVYSYNRSSARRIAQQLKPDLKVMDEATARLVAGRESVSVVISGAIRKSGSDYEVRTRAVDSVTGAVLMDWESARGPREKVLNLAGRLAGNVRKALGDTTPESVQLAAADTFTASSLEAAQSYSQAQEARFAGKAEDALTLFQKAIELDPKLGSAYAGLAVTYSNLGQRGEAQRYYQMALSHIDRMSEREKYRTRGAYYLTSLNHQKAMDEFTELARQFPADIGAYSNLAFVHYQKRDMARALAEGKRALDIYPKNSLLRSNYAMYAMYSGEFAMAEQEAAAVVQSSPSYTKAYNTLALSRLAQGQPARALEAYRTMSGINDRSASFAAMGLADLALFQGRLKDAADILEPAIAKDKEAGYKAGTSKKEAVLAGALLLMGHNGAAIAAADRAAAIAKEEIIAYEAGRVYIEAGQSAKALSLAGLLDSRLETDPQIYSSLIKGEVELKAGRAREALRYFQEAQKLGDTWLGRLSMGRVYLASGNFAEANSEFDRCQSRRGEAVELFLDEVQTLRYLPQVEYYIGRSREGLQSSGAKDSYKVFLSMKEAQSTEPMVVDARKRMAKLG